MNTLLDNAVVLLQTLGLLIIAGGFVLSVLRKDRRDDGLKGMARY